MSLSIGVLTVPGEDVGTVVSVPAPEVMPGCWLCLLWLCTSPPASLTAHCLSLALAQVLLKIWNFKTLS